MREVGCAVEGINNPLISGISCSALSPFFSQNAVGRMGSENGLHNAVFGPSIRIGHKVNGGLKLNAKAGSRMFAKHYSCRPGGSDCGFE